MAISPELGNLVKSDSSFPGKSRRSTRQIITLDSGEEIFYKDCYAEDIADREILSYAVATAIGACVPDVCRISGRAIVLTVVRGKAPTQGDYTKLVHSLPGQRIALLDQLVLNRDRHNGNWFNVDGVPWAIDFNNANFTGGNGDSAFGIHLKMASFGAYARRQIDRRLRALEPLFSAHQHADWYAAMMKRWARLSAEPLPLPRPSYRDKHGRFTPAPPSVS